MPEPFGTCPRSTSGDGGDGYFILAGDLSVPVVYFVDPSTVYSGVSLQVTIYASGILGAVTDVSIYPTGEPASALALSFTAADVNKIQAVIPAGLSAGSYDVVVTAFSQFQTGSYRIRVFRAGDVTGGEGEAEQRA